MSLADATDRQRMVSSAGLLSLPMTGLVVFSVLLSACLSRAAALPSGQDSVGKIDWGLLPALNYSADRGFGYGILAQRDDKRGPRYQPYHSSHRVVLQRTTRDISDYRYRFDSKYLLPAGLRLTAEVRVVKSLLEPYHGLGGAQTRYQQTYADSASPDYRGKFYYNYDKRFVRVDAIVQGRLWVAGFRWLGGVTQLATTIDTIQYADIKEEPTRQSLLANQLRAGMVDKTLFEASNVERSVLDHRRGSDSVWQPRILR